MRRALTCLAATLMACASPPVTPALIDGPSPVAHPAPAPPIPLEDISADAPLLHITSRGVDIWYGGVYVFPEAGCPADGPTICLVPEAERASDAPASAYDMGRLAATLAMFKEGAPDANRLLIAADPEIVYEVVVEVLDLSRPGYPDVSFVLVGTSE